jgi:hypothetical protein
MTTPLSPAAQAVKDAALAMYDVNVRRLAWPLDMPVVATAVRALVSELGVQTKGGTIILNGDAVLAIADELEGDAAEPADLSHLSDEQFSALCPQGHHAPGE